MSEQDRPAPRGPDEVRGALIAAATDLYRQRGPGSVTVKEIATHAGVNHGLVHHYFGSKDALTREVMKRQGAQIQGLFAEQSADLDTLVDTIISLAEEHDAGWRMLARGILDGHDDVLVGDHQGVKRLIDGITIAQREGLLAAGPDARHLAAGVLATVLGWLLFEPYVLASTEIRAEERRTALRATLGAYATAADQRSRA